MIATHRFARCVFAALLAGSLWGCDSGLGELKEPRLILAVGLGAADARDPKNPTSLGIYVDYEGECVELASATAEINGVDIPELKRGGMESGLATEHCTLKSFSSSSGLPAVDGAVSVRVSDGETTFEAQFAGICDKRTLAVRSPAGPLEGGDEVELEWLPARDVFVVNEVRLESADGRWYKAVAGEAVRQEGNRVFFTMPEVPAEAAGKLSLDLYTSSGGMLGSFFAKASKCEGASACLASCWAAEPEPIEINAIAGSGPNAVFGVMSDASGLVVGSAIHYAVESDDPAFGGSVTMMLSDVAQVCDLINANTISSESRALDFQLFNWDGTKNLALVPGEYTVGGDGSGARRFAEVRFVKREACDPVFGGEATGGTVTVSASSANGALEGSFAVSFGGRSVSGRFLAEHCPLPEEPLVCQ